MLAPNISATALAAQALCAAGRPEGAQAARPFIDQCQNFRSSPVSDFDDGGFFFAADDPIRKTLAEHHFDAIYLDDRRMEFIGEEFRSLMLEIWHVKYLQMPRFREVISSIPMEIRLEHFLNDGDSPDIPIPVYVRYLNQIRDMARAPN